MFRRIFDVTGRRRKLHNEGLYNLIIPTGTLRHGWKDDTKIVQKFRDRLCQKQIIFRSVQWLLSFLRTLLYEVNFYINVYHKESIANT